jgi:hypothetical protein
MTGDIPVGQAAAPESPPSPGGQNAARGLSEAEMSEEQLEGLANKRFKLIYHEVNNEIRVREREFEKYLEAQTLEMIGAWKDGFNAYGHFNNTLCISKTALWLRREWVPAPGYAWSEEEIYILSS